MGPVPIPGDAEPVALHEVDRRVARFVWLEQRRFEVLGGWTATMADAVVKAMVATQSHHHAWHASLWATHLPHRSGDAVPGPGPIPAGLEDFVEDLRGSHDALERLVGAYRVVAVHAVAAYTRQLELATAVSDAAVARTCRIVLADQLDDWRQGEAVLQALLATGADVERAGARQVHLERLLLDAGGFAGVGLASPPEAGTTASS